MNLERETYGLILITLVGALSLLAFFLFEAVPQDLQYHDFSDANTYLSIPNTLNVLSNVPFFMVGLAGMARLTTRQTSSLNIVKSNSLAYWVLFSGTALVGIGSGYYHLWLSADDFRLLVEELFLALPLPRFAGVTLMRTHPAKFRQPCMLDVPLLKPIYHQPDGDAARR